MSNKDNILSFDKGGDTSHSRLCVAQIATAHGIKGYVRVKVMMENPTDIENHNPLYTDETGSKTLTLSLKNSVKKQWLAEVEGVSDRNGAESLRGQKLYIDTKELPEINSDNEFYYKDLLGLSTISDKGLKIGTVLKVDNFGAGDLLEIKPIDGDSFYIPFKDEFVGKVDLDAQTIVIQNFEDYRF